MLVKGANLHSVVLSTFSAYFHNYLQHTTV